MTIWASIFAGMTEPTTPFVTVWTTTSSPQSITLPLTAGGSYNFKVDWGDGSAIATVTAWDAANATHEYATAGTYTVTIRGSITGWRFNNAGSKLALVKVKSWGTLIFNEAGGTNGRQFYGCTNLTSIPKLWPKITGGGDALYFFRACTGLTSVDLLDVPSFPVAQFMFYGCTGITSATIANASTLTSATYLFSGCSAMTSVTVAKASALQNASGMFNGCHLLTSVNLPALPAVTNTNEMFGSCAHLESVTLSDLSSLANGSYMFDGCSLLSSVSLPATPAMTNAESMFYQCPALTSVTLSDTHEVTNFAGTFWGCTLLTSVSLSNTAAATSFAYAFQDCPALSSVSLGDNSGSTPSIGPGVNLSVASCALDATALNNIFKSLKSGVSSKTIVVTGNSGAATCTTSLATNKGWSVTQ